MRVHKSLRIANCELRIILCIAHCKFPIKNKEPVPKKQWQSKTLFGVRACKRYKRARFHPSVSLIPVRFARQRWYRRGVPVNAFQRVSILSFDRMTGGTCPLSCSAQNIGLRLLYHSAAELSSGYFAFGDLYNPACASAGFFITHAFSQRWQMANGKREKRFCLRTHPVV